MPHEIVNELRLFVGCSIKTSPKAKYKCIKIGHYITPGNLTECKGKLAAWFHSAKAKSDKVIILDFVKTCHWYRTEIAHIKTMPSGAKFPDHYRMMMYYITKYCGLCGSIPNKNENALLYYALALRYGANQSLHGSGLRSVSLLNNTISSAP